MTDLNLRERFASDLLLMLHQEAPANEFAERLAMAERMAANDPAQGHWVELVRMAMGVRNRLDLSQQREAGMLAVMESAKDLSSRLNLQELLGAIVARARNILGSHVSWLSTFDETCDSFRMLAVDGALALKTGDSIAGRHLGIVGVVVSTRLPFTTTDYLSDTRFQHDPRLDSIFRDEGIAAVVGVPLLWEGEVIGLLFVADRYNRTHTAQSISVLSTLATHAALALKNAKAFEQASGALQAAEQARAEVEHNARRMQSAAEAHEQMTSLLAKGASLTMMCESMAQLLGGSVLVLDEAAQVLGRGDHGGSAAVVADHYTPHGEHSAALATALRQSRQVGRSAVAYESHGHSCRVNAVIGGNELLGSMLLFRAQPLDDIALRTFERCASVIGVVLLSRERAEEAKGLDQSATLRALLSPRQDDMALLVDRAQQLGIPLTQAVSLLLIESDDIKTSAIARRLRASQVLGTALFDDIDGALVVLCNSSRAEDLRKRLLEFMGGQSSEASTPEGEPAWRGVMSRPVSTPADLPALHTTLRRALPVLRRIGACACIIHQNELALYSTLFETHDQSSLSAFLTGTIGAITSYDERRGTQLTDSLLAYFEANQNAKLAAQRLGIHVNTVRQRLATIEDLLGHWGQAARALELHVALRLWRLSKGGQLQPSASDESTLNQADAADD